MPERSARESAAVPALAVRDLSVVRRGAGAAGPALLRDVQLDVPARSVLALVGPSGAGKTTLLRCLNRLIDLVPELVRRGEVLLFGRSTDAPGTDVDDLRRRVGYLFQQPVVFPGSIAENVLFGVRDRGFGRRARADRSARLERALAEAALWDEVRDRLHEPAAGLSVGQQQRLCLARALAVEPEVLLLDEPTSALDPRSTEAIEERIRALAATRTVVLVTHDLRQAERTADLLACVDRRAGSDGAGTVVECGACRDLMTRPRTHELARFLDGAVDARELDSAAPMPVPIIHA